METLYGAIDDGAIAVRTPKHAKKELEAYLDCGLLCRGFARLRCERCEESRLVAFSCKGRGFCPSCLGRRMCATAANLIEDVLPEVAHRPWVLTFPFPWRRRLAQDGASFGVLTRIFVESVERFYEERAARRGACGAVKSGAMTVVRRKALGDAVERLATRLPGQTNARTDTYAHGTPMRLLARAAPPEPPLSTQDRAHHDARGPPFDLLRYASSRCDPA
ncbi:transposase zinc-binding domain-containing protein [Sorangium sp. So ce381]|uniref:transposase zinc-binding domain-containing protein n=1 Tax=Sorangium sp. So ce381 TaxID=3133307 RepID=UPI003F5AFC7F